MHDLIFEHQRTLEDAALARLAAEAGVDAPVVLDDLRSGRFRDGCGKTS